jgi:hypothetical protein
VAVDVLSLGQDYSMPIHSSGQNGAAGGAAIPADANANGHIGENGESQGFLLPEKCIPAKVSLLPHQHNILRLWSAASSRTSMVRSGLRVGIRSAEGGTRGSTPRTCCDLDGSLGTTDYTCSRPRRNSGTFVVQTRPKRRLCCACRGRRHRSSRFCLQATWRG